MTLSAVSVDIETALCYEALQLTCYNMDRVQIVTWPFFSVDVICSATHCYVTIKCFWLCLSDKKCLHGKEEIVIKIIVMWMQMFRQGRWWWKPTIRFPSDCFRRKGLTFKVIHAISLIVFLADLIMIAADAFKGQLHPKVKFPMCSIKEFHVLVTYQQWSGSRFSDLLSVLESMGLNLCH